MPFISKCEQCGFIELGKSRSMIEGLQVMHDMKSRHKKHGRWRTAIISESDYIIDCLLYNSPKFIPTLLRASGKATLPLKV